MCGRNLSPLLIYSLPAKEYLMLTGNGIGRRKLAEQLFYRLTQAKHVDHLWYIPLIHTF